MLPSGIDKRIGLALGVLLLAAASADAQNIPSGIQLTPDSAHYLISKDVGAERWAITYNVGDETVTGNVFKTDGSPPQFIWCEIVGKTLNPDPAQNQYTLDCYGAEACVEAPCGDDEDWALIASGIPLSGSFLLPDNTKATLSGTVQPILTTTCAISLACHQAGGAGMLNLQQDFTFNSTVGVSTVQSGAKLLVDPFHPEASYMVDKLLGVGAGSQMPMGGQPLPPSQLEAIQNWILEGAVNN